MMISNILLVTLGVTVAYAITILIFTIGWKKIAIFSNFDNKKAQNDISIIIPFYNEEVNILNLLQDIEQLNYPSDMYEVILINNESTDKTSEIVRSYIFENDSKIQLHVSSGGKKDAIWMGINNAEHNYVLSIDADCRIPANILKEYDSVLQQKEVKLISGPVSFTSNNSIWGKFMEYEFMSLVATGAGSIGVNIPIMVNAANMLFEREAALDAEHVFISDEESGDDIFLLHYIVKKYGASKVRFLKSKAAIITTPAPKYFKSWVNQRLRWTAKAKDYKINATSITALVVLLLNVFIISLLFLSIVQMDYLYIAAIIVAIKTIIDLPILYMAAGFFCKKHIIKYSIIFELFYPFYIVIISIMSIYYNKKWKDES